LSLRANDPRIALGAALAAALAAPAAADCGPPSLQPAVLDRVTPEGDLALADGRVLRLAGLHIAVPPAVLLPRPGAALAIGLLDDRPDRWSRLPAVAFALTEGGPPLWLQQRLIERGAALARPEPGLGGCWTLLRQAEAAAEPALPETAPEPGRFARVAGRVSRVGEGRSAHFVTVWTADNQRVTGLVQKRHLKRFREAGVDVPALSGHVVRLRGVRSATNPALIALSAVEQIEIVR
jgi:hypothetical protein